jgi:Zn-finger nucleic acid-binding protein
MECPICKERLSHAWKGDILVDFCPGCGGAWLERGEFEKLLAHFSGERPRPERVMEGARDHHGFDEDRRNKRHDGHDSGDDYDDHDNRYGGRSGEHGGKRRRGGVLGNIMDMFG